MKIMLVDDHPIFLEGLKMMLTLRGMEVIGTASDGLEAFEMARTLEPEVILMDIRMPHLDGLTATRLIKADLPQVKIVMLSMSHDDDDLFEAIKSGASGYLLKTDDIDKFFEQLMGLVNGDVPLSPSLAGRVLVELARGATEKNAKEPQTEEDEILTARQIQVLTLVAEGLTYKEVGAKLFLSERTIKYHMGEIIERLHLNNRRQVIEYARRKKFDRR